MGEDCVDVCVWEGVWGVCVWQGVAEKKVVSASGALVVHTLRTSIRPSSQHPPLLGTRIMTGSGCVCLVGAKEGGPEEGAGESDGRAEGALLLLVLLLVPLVVAAAVGASVGAAVG